MESSLDKKIEELISTMTALGRAVSKLEPQSLEEHTATMLQYSALGYIKEYDGLTLGDISSGLGLSKSSATQLVDRLFKGKLIKRISDLKDRRTKHISITRNGVERFEFIKKQIRQKMKKILKKIPDEDIDHLLRIHKKLLENIM